MARKRGGIAGFYDRNKGLIKNVVPTALSFIPGVGVPLAIGTRAAMEGFDRPGKSGVGFDIGQGLKGAAIGAGQAALGQGAKSLFTAGGQTAATALPQASMNVGMTPGMTAGMSAPISAAAGTAATNVSGGSLGSLGSAALRGARSMLGSKEGLAFAGQAATAGANIYGQQQQAAMQREEMDRKRREDEARARLMALFAPSILEGYKRFGINLGGGA